MKKLTDEQREWIINHPDYPGWLIVENFKERFGIECPVDKHYVSQIRTRTLGTSNKFDPRSKEAVRHGKSREKRVEDFIIAQTEYFDD